MILRADPPRTGPRTPPKQRRLEWGTQLGSSRYEGSFYVTRCPAEGFGCVRNILPGKNACDGYLGSRTPQCHVRKNFQENVFEDRRRVCPPRAPFIHVCLPHA
jgi:hypothetical protein